MNYYISSDNVIAAIDYFIDADFAQENNLFLYLLSKHLGVTTTVPVNYRTGNMSDEEKKNIRHALWMLGGLFDSTEDCKKRGLMFPTAFTREKIHKDKNFYNPGTEFNSVNNRVADTIKQVNNTVAMWNYNDGIAVLKYNYRDLIKDKCLNGNKLSLSYLAAWVLRFTSFDFDAEPNEKQFTRVVEKTIRKFFKITKNDFLWLFENDLSVHRLTPSKHSITGEKIRETFNFEDKSPEIEYASEDTIPLTSCVENETVKKYIMLSGDNPSHQDILSILKNKKQIVFTGVPGVGKSRYTQMLCNDPFFAETKTIQFHASYTYEDFIGAETLKADEKGPYVETRKGVFLDFVDKASNGKGNYLFVIDELNRGNIAEIFGETILALDRSYTVDLNRTFEGISTLRLPENLFIIATMNTSDRNIAFLDLAIRRRFAFVPLTPNYDFLSEEVELEDIDLGIVLRTINQRILNTLKDPELILGQSYFIPPTNEDKMVWDFEKFKNQFNFVLLPTIKEYSFNEPSAVNSILGEALGDSIQDTDEFKAAFKAEFSI